WDILALICTIEKVYVTSLSLIGLLIILLRTLRALNVRLLAGVVLRLITRRLRMVVISRSRMGTGMLPPLWVVRMMGLIRFVMLMARSHLSRLGLLRMWMVRLCRCRGMERSRTRMRLLMIGHILRLSRLG